LLGRRNATKLIKSPIKTSFVKDMECQIQTVFILAFSMLLVAIEAFLFEYVLILSIYYYLMKIYYVQIRKGRLSMKNLYPFKECLKCAVVFSVYIWSNIKARLPKFASIYTCPDWFVICLSKEKKTIKKYFG